MVSVVRKILQTKIQVLEKLNKIDWYFYQIVLVVARKKLTFIENQELNETFTLIEFKMNQAINKFFFDWRQINTRIVFKQPGFAYTACGPFTKHWTPQ